VHVGTVILSEAKNLKQRGLRSFAVCAAQDDAQKKICPALLGGGASSLLDVRGANAQGREFKSVRFKEDFKKKKL